MGRPLAVVLVLTLVLFLALPAGAWNAPGHRTITRLAVAALPDDGPAGSVPAPWVRSPDTIRVAAYNANEPDRWRGAPRPALKALNEPDHYIDLELLEPYGLTLETLPPRRHEFLTALVRGGPEPGERRGVITFDPGRVGFLPYAIEERYSILVSSFRIARTLDALEGRLDETDRRAMVDAARANARAAMGQLSHFVGDAAQPLHTTIHHHGWVGANPRQYTTDRGFHQRIDGGVVALHGLNDAALGPAVGPAPEIAPDQVGVVTRALIRRSFDELVPLYELERSGALDGPEGRAFIAARMTDATRVLAGLYRTAWIESEPTAEQLDRFLTFNEPAAERTWQVVPLAERGNDPASESADVAR